ncbi:MAG: hypothetical protein ACK5PQ_02805 [Alphaproteobacteria bacterium]
MIQFLKIFGFFLLIGFNTSFARSNLSITDVQVGSELNKSRLSFQLTQPVSLYVQSDDAGFITVSGPEDTFWNIPARMIIKRGALIQYNLTNDRGKKYCIVQLSPYSRVVGSFLRGKSFIIDIITEEPPVIEPEVDDEAMEMDNDPELIPAPLPPPPPIVNIQQTVSVPQNEINSLTIVPNEDGSTWIIVNADKAEFFDSQMDVDTKKLNLYLPKINWPSVKTESLSSGHVISYRVDESNAASSIVVFDLMDNTHLVDFISSPNLDGTYDFILVLVPRPATPGEIKKLSEKRMELKSRLAGNQNLNFTISPPQMVVDGPNEEPMMSSLENVTTPTTSFSPQEEVDPLFDPLDFSQ